MTRALLHLLLPLALLMTACGEVEGPAVEVFLQVVRARPDVDTSDVQGFFVKVGDVGQAVAFNPEEPQVMALEAPPEADTAFVVFACLSGGCAAQLATFVGCTVKDLEPSDDGIPVIVGLDAIAPLPSECDGLVPP